MPESVCPADLVAFADHLGEVAADLLRNHARGKPAVEIKADGTPVTDADKAVEAVLRAEIRAAHPGHGILGEEFPPERADADFVWNIDPVDGTKEFIQGLPLFGTLIALAHRGAIVLGLARQPLTGDCWLGADGHGTRWNSAAIAVRQCASLDRAVLSTMGYDTFCATEHGRLSPLRRRARELVTADSFVVFGLLAAGRVDAIASRGFALHDYAALDAIVRNAGGHVTDWAGRRLTLTSDGTIAAAGDTQVQAELLLALA